MSLQAFSDAVLASGPAGYYPLNNLSDLGADASPLNNHGSQSGTFTQETREFLGTAVTMTRGVSSPLVSIPDLPEYRGQTITLELILADWEDDNLVIAERGGDNKNWSLQSAGSGFGLTPYGLQFVLGAQIGTSNMAYSRVDGMSGVACHLIISSNGGYTKVWLNGVLINPGAGQSGTGIQQTQSSLPVHLFSRGGLYGTQALMAHLAIYDRMLTDAEILSHLLAFGGINPKTFNPGLAWANQETRAQAWPGENSEKALKPDDRRLAYRKTQVPLLIDGAELGFIADSVTINEVGVSRRVLCFEQSGALVAETRSDANGNYRFDHLWRNRKYMCVAQDHPDYQYEAVAADWLTPEAYA